MTSLEIARKFAEERHKNLYDGKTYSFHLEQVLATLLEFDKSASEEEQVVAILHDILEDTETSKEDLLTLFGQEIAELVYLLTDEPGKNRKERKEKTYPKIASSSIATKIKLADRIANVRYSKTNTPGILKLYRKEQIAFQEALMRTIDGRNILYREMWAALAIEIFE